MVAASWPRNATERASFTATVKALLSAKAARPAMANPHACCAEVSWSGRDTATT